MVGELAEVRWKKWRAYKCGKVVKVEKRSCKVGW